MNTVASAALFAALQRHCPDDEVIGVDIGNHTCSFGRYFGRAPASSTSGRPR